MGKKISKQTERLLAQSLITKLSRDFAAAADLEEHSRTSVRDVVLAAIQVGISAEVLASAFFVEIDYQIDDASLKNEFDEELQSIVGDDYAMNFLQALTSWEAIQAAQMKA